MIMPELHPSPPIRQILLDHPIAIAFRIRDSWAVWRMVASKESTALATRMGSSQGIFIPSKLGRCIQLRCQPQSRQLAQTLLDDVDRARGSGQVTAYRCCFLCRLRHLHHQRHPVWPFLLIRDSRHRLLQRTARQHTRRTMRS